MIRKKEKKLDEQVVESQRGALDKFVTKKIKILRVLEKRIS